jgi:cytochrome c oxidase subunit I
VIDRDDFWLQKHPEFAHNNEAREDGSKYDEHGIHMPGQSWYPFIMSLGILVGSYGLLYGNWVLGILHFLLVMASAYGWAFEGVGGKHVFPKGKGHHV